MLDAGHPDDATLVGFGTESGDAQGSAMIRVAFFGHDAGDAAVRRRVRAMQDDGVSVRGFMMRRQDDVATEWDNIDLGQTRDGAFVQRVAHEPPPPLEARWRMPMSSMRATSTCWHAPF
jgi:hypothetical protein